MRIAPVAKLVGSAGLALGAWLLVAAAPVAAADIVVTTAADGPESGLGCTLRNAILSANMDDGVDGCDAGSGADLITFNDAMTISLAAALPEVTSVIAINGPSVVVDGGDAHQLFRVAGGGSLAISAMTLQHGYTAGSGAAIYAAGTVTLTGVIVSNNTAQLAGGGIRVTSTGTATITDSTVHANMAHQGGAVSSSGTLTINDTTLDTNQAVNLDVPGQMVWPQGDGGALWVTGPTTITGGYLNENRAGRGGGIFADLDQGASLLVDGTTLWINDAEWRGGGLYASRGQAQLTNVLVTGNSSGEYGGGIDVEVDAQVTLIDSTVEHSVARYGGGLHSYGQLMLVRTTVNANTSPMAAGILQEGDLVAVASTFTGNVSEIPGEPNLVGDGSGILVWTSAGETFVNGCSFSGNHSVNGGAIYAHQPITIVNSTFAGNIAQDGGGAISTVATATLENVTITGNTATTGGGLFAAAQTDLWNTLILGNGPDEWAGVTPELHTSLVALPQGTTLADVFSGGIADHGGPTQTVALTPNLPTNPAVGTGDPDTCAGLLGLDQRGRTRPAAGCDMGAFELDDQKPTATVPAARIEPNQQVTGGLVRLWVTWSGHDNVGGTGVAAWRLELSINGGAWSSAKGDLGQTWYNPFVPVGSSVRFRVQAVDGDGTVSAWATGPSIGVGLTQQTSTAIRWAGAWSTQSGAAFSGGSVKWASTAGAGASYTFTGRQVALVTTKAPNRGKAKVYLDGALQATLDLGGTAVNRTVAWRYAWTASGTHTVRIVVVGTAGRPRVDVDAFIVLK